MKGFLEPSVNTCYWDCVTNADP